MDTFQTLEISTEEDKLALQSIIDVLENGGADIKKLKEDIDGISNLSNIANEFLTQINVYKHCEILVEQQLTQLDDFLDSNTLLYESVNLSKIRIDINKELEGYKNIVLQNNVKTTNVKKAYIDVKERIISIEKISNNRN